MARTARGLRAARRNLAPGDLLRRQKHTSRHRNTCRPHPPQSLSRSPPPGPRPRMTGPRSRVTGPRSRVNGPRHSLQPATQSPVYSSFRSSFSLISQFRAKSAQRIAPPPGRRTPSNSPAEPAGATFHCTMGVQGIEARWHGETAGFVRCSSWLGGSPPVGCSLLLASPNGPPPGVSWAARAE